MYKYNYMIYREKSRLNSSSMGDLHFVKTLSISFSKMSFQKHPDFESLTLDCMWISKPYSRILESEMT